MARHLWSNVIASMHGGLHGGFLTPSTHFISLVLREAARGRGAGRLDLWGDRVWRWGAAWVFQLQAEALSIRRCLASRNTVFELWGGGGTCGHSILIAARQWCARGGAHASSEYFMKLQLVCLVTRLDFSRLQFPGNISYWIMPGNVPSISLAGSLARHGHSTPWQQ